MSDERKKQLEDPVKTLFTYGVILGGVVPAALVYAFNLWGNFIPEVTSHWYDGIVICFFTVFVVLISLAFKFQDLTNLKSANLTVRAGGLLSIAFLSALVICTGGPIASPFSFHYLYIPVVAGLCLDRRIDAPSDGSSTQELRKMGWRRSESMIQAALACALAYVSLTIVLYPAMCSFTRALATQMEPMAENVPYLTAYTVVFLIQVVVACYIAVRIPQGVASVRASDASVAPASAPRERLPEKGSA